MAIGKKRKTPRHVLGPTPNHMTGASTLNTSFGDSIGIRVVLKTPRHTPPDHLFFIAPAAKRFTGGCITVFKRTNRDSDAERNPIDVS